MPEIDDLDDEDTADTEAEREDRETADTRPKKPVAPADSEPEVESRRPAPELHTGGMAQHDNPIQRKTTMPQSSVDSKLSTAKTILSGAKSKFPAAPPRAGYIADSPAPRSQESVGDELAAKKANVEQYTGAVQRMHSGGPITADGVYRLKKGEHVLTADKSYYKQIFEARKAKAEREKADAEKE